MGDMDTTRRHFVSGEGGGLHTVGGLFCFLDFRLDLCFAPRDFVFFKWGEKK